jgi:hypothetical protein
LKSEASSAPMSRKSRRIITDAMYPENGSRHMDEI